LSAYLCNEKTVQCAVQAIARLPSRRFAGITLPSEHTSAAAVALYSTIGKELWRMNALAVAGRYAKEAEETPPFSFDPDLAPSPKQFVGSFQCLIYQTAENPVVTTKFYQAMEAVEQELAREFPGIKGSWGILNEEVIPLAEGVEVRRRATERATAELLKASERGDDADVARRLADGADPNAADKHGVHALTYAAVGGHGACLRALLAGGANVAAGDGEALSEAVRVGHTDAVRLLLAAGADPDALGGRRVPPLALAVAYERPDSVALLLEAGATVSDSVRRGASVTGHREIAALIDDAVADRLRGERLAGAGRVKVGEVPARFDLGDRKP